MCLASCKEPVTHVQYLMVITSNLYSYILAMHLVTCHVLQWHGQAKYWHSIDTGAGEYLEGELAGVGQDHVVLAESIECVLIAVQTADVRVTMGPCCQHMSKHTHSDTILPCKHCPLVALLCLLSAFAKAIHCSVSQSANICSKWWTISLLLQKQGCG